MSGDAAMLDDRRTAEPTQDAPTASPARMLALGPGEGTPYWFLQNRMVLKATVESTGGAFGLVESLIAPGAAPPLHVHYQEDEAFYVLEGELTFQCGDETARATAGSFVFLPRGIPHGFVVESDTPVRMLTLLVPGGGERIFVEAGRPAEGPGLPPAAPPDLPLLKRVARKYGNDIVGPPIQRAASNPAAAASTRASSPGSPTNDTLSAGIPSAPTPAGTDTSGSPSQLP
jgi:quercetin dioxygenase-like cupin family protein